MQQHRIISLLSILVMLIIPVIGWFLIAQPQLAAAATADQQRADAASQVAASQAVVDKLAGKDLPKHIDTGFYWYDKTNITDPKIAADLYN